MKTYVELHQRKIDESEKAICFDFDGRAVWLPKSQLKVEKDPFGLFHDSVSVASWLITKNGLWEHFKTVVSV